MNEDNIIHTIEAPQKRYRTILADPPWDISQAGGRGAIQHYPLMTVEQIANMPVSSLAEDDAHLWLWVTNGSWRAGYDIMTAWGFTYRSPLTWVKPRLQLGQYLRNMTEHVLFGTRGKAPVNFRAQPTWFIAPVQEHSHKPEEQYAIIERVSRGPYLELFARRRQPGWDVWGNEIDADIVLPGYPVPSDRKHSDKATDDPHAAPPGLTG
ncbi:MT-A70 family methyltransferase [Nocardia sp. NPDC051929]|uniref:MT-A70 family methyltransferase n=1 Tax=Nocardia sp. NPDC051929 TaxID=3364327 RepID=UPI0037C8A236